MRLLIGELGRSNQVHASYVMDGPCLIFYLFSINAGTDGLFYNNLHNGIGGQFS